VAEELAVQAMQISMRILSHEHPKILNGMNIPASTYCHLG
jgi:hypothetical protein